MSDVHVMLDIETLGTRPGSMIASIGACVFAPGRPRAERPAFHVRPTLDDQARIGLTMDPATVMWWMGQDDAARAALSQRHPVTLACALLSLRDFLRIATCNARLHLWSYGPSFDAALIERAWHHLKLEGAPWSYRDLRCLRTLLHLAGLSMRNFPAEVQHDALADAMAQADAAEAAMRILSARVAGAAPETAADPELAQDFHAWTEGETR